MPFVPLHLPAEPVSPVWPYVIIAVVGVAVAIVAIVVHGRARAILDKGRRERVRDRWLGIFVLAVAGALVSAAFAPAAMANTEKDHQAKVREAFREWEVNWAAEALKRYGISLLDETFDSLDFPRERPDAARGYGATQLSLVNGDGEVLTTPVHLVTDGERFQLLHITADGVWAELPIR